MQNILMKFDPATGEERPYPSHAAQWREWHGVGTAWLFDPWTGRCRDARDVGSDVHGLLIVPAGTLGMDMGGDVSTFRSKQGGTAMSAWLDELGRLADEYASVSKNYVLYEDYEIESARAALLAHAGDYDEQKRQADFYRRRCNALQKWQSWMRDPERTVVCDILANGNTLPPGIAGNRYAAQKGRGEG